MSIVSALMYAISLMIVVFILGLQECLFKFFEIRKYIIGHFVFENYFVVILKCAGDKHTESTVMGRFLEFLK